MCTRGSLLGFILEHIATTSRPLILKSLLTYQLVIESKTISSESLTCQRELITFKHLHIKTWNSCILLERLDASASSPSSYSFKVQIPVPWAWLTVIYPCVTQGEGECLSFELIGTILVRKLKTSCKNTKPCNWLHFPLFCCPLGTDLLSIAKENRGKVIVRYDHMASYNCTSAHGQWNIF